MENGKGAMCLNDRLRLLGLGVLMAAMMFVAGCGQNNGASQKPSKPAPGVGVVTVQTHAIELFTALPGRTKPYRVAEIRPQVSGIVQKRAFKQGAEVDKGELLYQIDPKPYEASLAQAKAALAEAKAAVTSVAQRVERYKELIKINAISQQEYDNAKAKLARMQAQVQRAKAQVQTARIKLGYTSVESPISGLISRSYITEGALVTANQAQKLAQVTQLDPIYVDIPRSTEQILKLKRAFKQGALNKSDSGGAKVTLLQGNGQEYAHTGTIKFSGVTVDPGTASVVLRAKFPNPEHELMPGMFVRVRLSEGVRQNAILVPQQGVVHDDSGQPYALVVGKKNRLKKRTLEIDRAIGTYWLVTDGLSEGDRVLVTGRQRARAGMKVKPEPADIPNKLTGEVALPGPAHIVTPESSSDRTQSSAQVETSHG